MSFPMTGSPIWYKVRHPEFDPDRAYRALGYETYGETAWAYLVFVTHEGKTYQVQVWRCTALPVTCESHDPRSLSREQTETERLYAWARKPARRNPDLDTDL